MMNFMLYMCVELKRFTNDLQNMFLKTQLFVV